jgi:hypothetical protein
MTDTEDKSPDTRDHQPSNILDKPLDSKAKKPNPSLNRLIKSTALTTTSIKSPTNSLSESLRLTNFSKVTSPLMSKKPSVSPSKHLESFHSNPNSHRDLRKQPEVNLPRTKVKPSITEVNKPVPARGAKENIGPRIPGLSLKDRDPFFERKLSLKPDIA